MHHLRAWFVYALIACASSSAWALDPNRTITQYRHDFWQIGDGLPQNSALAVQQTPDGYLWVSTQEGLARFDGLQFTVFDSTNTPQLGSKEIWHLAVDSAGTLWIGTDAGVSYFRDGAFHQIEDPQLRAVRVQSLLAAQDGSVWISGQIAGEAFVSRLERDRVVSRIKVDSSIYLLSLLQRRDGSVVGGGKKGVYRVNATGLELLKPTKGEVYTLAETSDGSLWAGTSDGAVHWKDGVETALFERDGLPAAAVTKILEDRSGNLWIGTARGIARIDDGHLTVVPASSLSGASVQSIYEDRDGQLWVGTFDGGLNRFTNGVFTPFGAPEGLNWEATFATLEDSRGALWLGTIRGLARIDKTGVKHFGAEDGLAEVMVDGLAESPDGTIWVSTTTGIYKGDGEHFQRFSLKDGIASDHCGAILPDSRGNIWFGTFGELTVLRDGRFEKVSLGPILDKGATILHEDRSGRIWIGTRHGLFLLDNGALATFPGQESLHDKWVLDVVDDPDGTVWVGTNTGIARLRQEGIKMLALLPGSSEAFRLLDDAQGNFWITCNHGVYRVSKRELNDAADGKGAPTLRTFGLSDGWRTTEFNGGEQPAGTKLKDGRLVFPTLRGIVTVDPSRVRPAKPLEARILGAHVDGHAIPTNAGLRLPPGRNDLEIHVSTFVSGDPKEVRFRWKLTPYDKEWRAATDQRTAIYTNISPGNYQFEVAAADRSGSFGPTATMQLGFAPRLDQTWWFYALCGLAIGTLVGATFWARVRRLRRRERWLQTAVEERTAELAAKNSDLDENIRKLRETQAQLVQAGKMAAVGTLAAGVGHEINNPLAYIISNLVFASDQATELAEQFRSLPPNSIPGRQHPSARLEEMDDALRDALQGAERVRLIVRDLKIFSRSEDEQGAVDLHQVIDSAAKMGANEVRPRARLVKEYGQIPLVDGNESRLSQVFLNLFINAAHAVGEGRAIENRIVVSTRIEGARVIAEVRDTGCGMTKEILARIFDPFFTTKPVGVGTGLGLSLCHTFIHQMGGEISVESTPGAGTVFRISLRASASAKAPIRLPAKLAYSAGTRARILIIDDEPLVTSALRRALGHEQDVEIVHSGRRALDLLSAPESRFDVILCDLMMPDLSGMEVYDEVRRIAPRHLPGFIFVTGGAFTPGAKEFLERIPNPWMEKPFDPAQIRALVSKHAGQVERQRGTGLHVA
jgi:signal transduction histidine kinase/ligand-binding sensor domain-containing protein/CheY-like chemotaxis protein